jgi:DNA polymerase-3 subunit delta'
MLFGHENTESMLLKDLASGKLPHGIIFSGAKGIGKATLAYRFARALLSGSSDMQLSPSHPVFSRVAAGSHSDLLVIEPLYDPKKDEFASDIKVEQIRAIAQFLSLTPGEGKWRVVIIDSADNLNISSANAILKILEEPPPQTMLMLITHNDGQLLPTIRSRCRIISLKLLSREDFARVVRLSSPEIYGEDLAALEIMSARSPGVALELHAQGTIELYKETLALLSATPNLDNKRVLEFCEQIGSGKKAHGRWQLFRQIMLCIIERVAKKSAGVNIALINEEEGRGLQALAKLHNPLIWTEKWQQAAEQFSLAQRLHLDYKQVSLTFFHSLAGTEEFNLGNMAA